MVFHFDIRNSSKRSSRRSHCYEMRLFFYGFSTIVHRHHLSCNAIIFKPWCSWCFLLTILLTLLVVSVAITFFPCQMNQRWKKTWHYGISCKSQIRLFSKSKTNLFMSWGIFNERKRDVIAKQIILFRFLEALTRLAGKDSDGHFCSRASYYISFIDGQTSNLTAIRVWWGKMRLTCITTFGSWIWATLKLSHDFKKC